MRADSSGCRRWKLWVDYFALGGTLDAIQLNGYLRGDGDIGDADHNVLVHALNEVFRARGQDQPLAYRPL